MAKTYQFKNKFVSVSHPVNVFWFRRDLRIDDNTALFHALKSDHPVLPIFIFDTNILNKLKNDYDMRINFIHQSLKKIESELANHNSGLLVLYGDPQEVWRDICKKYQIDSVYFNHDYEPYAIDRDAAVTSLLKKNGVGVNSFKDQVIFEKQEILKDDNTPYTIFTPYSKKWKDLLDTQNINPYPSEKIIDNWVKVRTSNIPTIDHFGFKSTDLNIPATDLNEKQLSDYDKHRDFPAIEGTSRMSVHLRFGTVSIRRLVRNALQINETWLNELIWRDFFMMILFHFPHVINEPFKEKYAAIQWQNNPDDFHKWCNGMTGYPMVDAGMRELNTTGFMHNRVRMVTASFLTKHLLIDWLWGEKYFAEKLMDYDLSANNGNWQWAAGCGCDAAPYFRIFNPTTQQKKFDPDERYIKKWIPELGTDSYPEQIVEHSFARERALHTFKIALQNPN